MTASPHTHTTQDAALYVREGEDNDMFYQHPQCKRSKRAYQALHSTVHVPCVQPQCVHSTAPPSAHRAPFSGGGGQFD